MDASTVAIIVAIVGGIFSLSGISLQVRETVRSRRQTALTTLTTTQITVEEQRARRNDERDAAYIKRMEEREARAEARAEKAENTLAQLRAENAETLARVDALEEALAKAQLRIRELLDAKG